MQQFLSCQSPPITNLSILSGIVYCAKVAYEIGKEKGREEATLEMDSQ